MTTATRKRNPLRLVTVPAQQPGRVPLSPEQELVEALTLWDLSCHCGGELCNAVEVETGECQTCFFYSLEGIDPDYDLRDL